MAHHEFNSTPTPASNGDRVAAFDTAYGAELAASYLDGQGFDQRDIVIVPAGTQPLPDWERRVRRRERPLTAAIVGAMLFFTVLAITVVGRSWSIVEAVLLAGLVAAAVAGAWLWVTSSWATRVRARARSERLVVADRFEVWCSHDVSRARRALARWWNPEAEPVRVRRPADLHRAGGSLRGGQPL